MLVIIITGELPPSYNIPNQVFGVPGSSYGYPNPTYSEPYPPPIYPTYGPPFPTNNYPYPTYGVPTTPPTIEWNLYPCNSVFWIPDTLDWISYRHSAVKQEGECVFTLEAETGTRISVMVDNVRISSEVRRRHRQSNEKKDECLFLYDVTSVGNLTLLKNICEGYNGEYELSFKTSINILVITSTIMNGEFRIKVKTTTNDTNATTIDYIDENESTSSTTTRKSTMKPTKKPNNSTTTTTTESIDNSTTIDIDGTDNTMNEEDNNQTMLIPLSSSNDLPPKNATSSNMSYIIANSTDKFFIGNSINNIMPYLVHF